MTIKTQIFGIVVALVVLGFLFIQNPVVSDTRGRITVLEETQTYVKVQAGAQVGRLYKEFEFDFDAPVISDWFGAQLWNADQSGANVFAQNGAARFAANSAIDGAYKSVLQNAQLWFVNGDDLWFQARFLLDDGLPNAIFSLVDNSSSDAPGIHIVIDENQYIGIDMRTEKTASLRQSIVTVPRGKWFELTIHLVLNNRSGQVQIWQDGQLILEDSMKTMPTSGALLNALEIGITAADRAAVMLIDDLRLSHQPI